LAEKERAGSVDGRTQDVESEKASGKKSHKKGESSSQRRVFSQEGRVEGKKNFNGDNEGQ